MRAIILSAGKGSRLGLKDVPKCLLKVGDETILARQIKILKMAGIENIDVVIGYGGGVWIKENINKVKKINERVVLNRDFMTTQSPYSLYLAMKNRRKETLLVLDGDLIFEQRVIELLANIEGRTTLLLHESEKSTGSGVVLEVDKGYGFVVKSIGEDIMSDYVYAGLMRVDKRDYKLFEEKLKTGIYNNTILAKLLQDISYEKKIGAIRLVTTKRGEELLEVDLMSGGSYSKTSKIVKGADEVIIRKETVVPGGDKLIDEITWLNRLPVHVKRHFPEIENYNISKESTYFEMRYYDLPTLRDLLLRSEIKAQKAVKILGNIFNFMFNEICVLNIENAPPNFVREVHLKKIFARLMETYSAVGIFRDIINIEYIEINNKGYKNILPLVKEISRDREFIKWVSPEKTCNIHGDLHFDNMLIDKNGDFILIDPRGYDRSDIAYDIGKVWHSCHGLYDFIHTDRFELKKRSKSITYKINVSNALFEYRKIYRALPKILSKYAQVELDPNFLNRVFFSEATHFCSVIPFQLKHDGKEKIALACYAIGVELLNNIYNIWLQKIGGREVIEGKIVNINTIEDYEEAKEIFR